MKAPLVVVVRGSSLVAVCGGHPEFVVRDYSLVGMCRGTPSSCNVQEATLVVQGPSFSCGVRLLSSCRGLLSNCDVCVPQNDVHGGYPLVAPWVLLSGCAEFAPVYLQWRLHSSCGWRLLRLRQR